MHNKSFGFSVLNEWAEIYNWPFTKTIPPSFVTVAVQQAIVLMKNTSQSKEKTDNAPTDKTEQATLKQSLSFYIL